MAKVGGGMRKRLKVLVAINTLTSIQSGPYTDHMRLFYRLGRDYKYIDFAQMMARRMSIDRFRNTAAKACLESNFDYLFFIDDDMHLPMDTFERLYQAKMDIIMAHVYIRGYPFEIMAFKNDPERAKKNQRHLINLTQEDLKSDKVRKDGVLACDAIGTAVSLIKVDVLRRTPAPWFVTGQRSTEDIYFCCKARDNFKKTTIGMHTKVITGHVLDPEVISVDTRDAHLTYIESFLSENERRLIHEAKTGDRGEVYVGENVEGLVDPEAPLGECA